jgi:hypothetical protein
MNDQEASSLFVILILHHRWAGPLRNQGALRRPPHEIFVRRSCVAYFLTEFSWFNRFPKLHSGP